MEKYRDFKEIESERARGPLPNQLHVEKVSSCVSYLLVCLFFFPVFLYVSQVLSPIFLYSLHTLLLGGSYTAMFNL